MVLHGVVTYFNERTGEMEYLLAGESSAGVAHNHGAPADSECVVDCSFSGRSFAGFLGGTHQVSYRELHGDAPPQAFYRQARELDDAFEDIRPNRYYGHIPMLKNADSYWMLVAKRTPEMLLLYTVAKQTRLERVHIAGRVPPHRATLLHVLGRGQLDEVAASTGIFSLGRKEYVGMDSAAVHDLETAQEFSRNLFGLVLSKYNGGKRPGPMVFYTVGFDGVQRL